MYSIRDYYSEGQVRPAIDELGLKDTFKVYAFAMACSEKTFSDLFSDTPKNYFALRKELINMLELDDICFSMRAFYRKGPTAALGEACGSSGSSSGGAND